MMKKIRSAEFISWFGVLRHVLAITALAVWFSVGVFCYTSGFLLTRHEVNITSTCKNEPSLSNVDSNDGTSTCWTVPEVGAVYKKFIIIIIDALRYDFALYKENITQGLPYQNKLKVFKDLAETYGCKSAKLFRFHADAPTTTMQRIKGMTTGSFPTFIDVSNNFDSSEIVEDNVIDQLRGNIEENITFLGDDTWIKLFPGRFKTAYAFPSFDVKDLHTVDDGVIKHLVGEINKSNWKLLIAHFLGVDHCGHRYGPLHEEMSAKLLQMDAVVRSVISAMDNDTIAFVLGDHGMTQTGDHGGDSPNEVNAAMFAFSKKGRFLETQLDANCDSGLVHQIDLVPTLSLLLGTPIPFSNLGSVITDLIPEERLQKTGRTNNGATWSNSEKALWVNAKQIETYLREYNKRYNKFNSPHFLQLIKSLSLVFKEKVKPEQIQRLLHGARDLCKQVWATFDEKLILSGILCFASTSICLFCHLLSKKGEVIFGAFSCLNCLVFLFVNPNFQSLLLLPIFIFLLFILCYFLLRTGSVTFVSLVCVFYPILYMSNSFVLCEDSISLFLLSTTLLYISFDVTKSSLQHSAEKRKSKSQKFKSWKKYGQSLLTNVRRPIFFFVMLLAFLLVLLRSAFLFRLCRPEQHWCFDERRLSGASDTNAIPSNGTYYTENLLNFSDPFARLLLSGGSIVAMLVITTLQLKREGNLRRPLSASVICSTVFLPLATVCIIGNWLLSTISAKDLDSLPSNFVTFLPRCAYIILLVALLWWFIFPLTVNLMYQDRYGQLRDNFELSEREVITYYYQQLKKQEDNRNRSTRTEQPDDIQHPLNPDKSVPVMIGAYTLLSAALIGIGQVIILLLVMLLEEKYTPVLLTFIVASGCILEILSVAQLKTNYGDNKVSWDAVGIWMLSSSFWWFTTGHQASISNIPWNAAFVGFRGSHPTVWLPAIMVGANIYSSQILHTVFLPLLMLWPITRGRWCYASNATKNAKSDENRRNHNGDDALSQKYTSELKFLQSTEFADCLRDLLLKYILLHSLKILGCMCAAFHLRRHLMVWSIFAPRFMYETLGFAIVCLSSLFVYLFVVRFQQALRNWIKSENLS